MGAMILWLGNPTLLGLSNDGLRLFTDGRECDLLGMLLEPSVGGLVPTHYEEGDKTLEIERYVCEQMMVTENEGK
jgi:hypothetical protein